MWVCHDIKRLSVIISSCLESSLGMAGAQSKEKQDLYYFSIAVVTNYHKYIGAYGFPGSSVVKNLPANAGDMGSVPELGRSSGGGNGNPLQYSCLENPMDRGTWWAT